MLHHIQRWLFVTVWLTCVVASDSSTSSSVATYQLRTLHTLSTSSTRSLPSSPQRIHLAQLHLQLTSPFDRVVHSVASASSSSSPSSDPDHQHRVRVVCEQRSFDVVRRVEENESENDAIIFVPQQERNEQQAATGLAAPIDAFVDVVKRLDSFHHDNSKAVKSAYLLLHEFNTSRSDENGSARRRKHTKQIKPCSTSNLTHPLACCSLHFDSIDEKGHGRHEVVPITPLIVRAADEEKPQLRNPFPASSSPSSSASKQNVSELLLDWRRALHELSTPSAHPSHHASHAPSHLPPSHAQRRAFLRSAVRRAARVHANARGMDDASRILPRQHDKKEQHERSEEEIAAENELVSFIEESGWSTQSLHDANIYASMSASTRALIEPTAEDDIELHHTFHDITATFLETLTQIKSHFRAGVSARQAIALVANKMVLRDMPPKVGFGICKGLQQPILNMMKKALPDQFVKYLVPPGTVGKVFLERRSEVYEATSGDSESDSDADTPSPILPLTPASSSEITLNTISQLRAINPEVAEKMEEIEIERVKQDGEKQREEERRREDQKENGVWLEMEESVKVGQHRDQSKATPTTASASSPPSSSPSFLSTSTTTKLFTTSTSSVGKAPAMAIKDIFTNILTNGLIHDVTAQLQTTLHVLLHEELRTVLHKDISKALIKSLTKSLTESISKSQVELLSTTLRHQLTRAATSTLTKHLTLSLVPALSLILTRSLTRSPHEDYYCELCKSPVKMEKPAEFHLDPPAGADPEHPYCLSCKDSLEREYYHDYYSSYYAKYYSSYFSYYYSTDYAKRAADETLGWNPIRRFVRDSEGPKTEEGGAKAEKPKKGKK